MALLTDKTTKKNILWATKDYESLGPEYGETCEIIKKMANDILWRTYLEV